MNAVTQIEQFCLTATPDSLSLFLSVCEAEFSRRGVSSTLTTTPESERTQIVVAFNRGWDALTTGVMKNGGNAVASRKSLQEFQAGIARLAA